jgi:hypothetical protein
MPDDDHHTQHRAKAHGIVCPNLSRGDDCEVMWSAGPRDQRDGEGKD